jgi:hypothetical protein
MTWRLLMGCAALAALICTSCGERTYKVSGTVTFEGAVVENGSIVFDDADGGPGNHSSGITNGKYELFSKVGKKKVVISARKIRPGTENDPQPVMEEYIPVKYNVETTLVKEVMPAENRFDLKK